MFKVEISGLKQAPIQKRQTVMKADMRFSGISL